jgi:lysophospholipase L1-like esterase
MPRRRVITAAAAAAVLLAAGPSTAATATGRAQPLPASATAWPGLPRRVPPLAVSLALAACEHRLEGARQHAARTLAVVGASFTAGVGPGGATRSWAVLLADMLHWDAVVDGVPGAGYARAGPRGQGPVAAELTGIGLRALAPSLVIIQAGHDDIGVPVRVEQHRVRQAIALIRAQAPHARIALITVFTSRHRRVARQHAAAAAYRTDHAIVAAATAADHNVIIMDPLTAHWAFARSHDGLHPTMGGSQWIARTVAGVLRSRGIAAAARSAAAGTPLVCDSGITSERLRAGQSRHHPHPVPAGSRR